MHNKATDAELVQFLKAVREFGSASAAARELGLSQSAGRTRAQEAKGRGLTADSPVVDEMAKLKARLEKVTAELRETQRSNADEASIREAIFGLSKHNPTPPDWVLNIGKKGAHQETPMTIWSDWHWGEVVKADEVGGANEFNNAIARERVEKLVSKTIDLCKNHHGDTSKSMADRFPGIIVMLGGDMMTGDIHEELAVSNDRTPIEMVNELSDVLAAALTTVADHFGRVFVPCVVGNHGRTTKKPRMKGRVTHSYEWAIYTNLERYFKNDKRFQFYVAPESDAYFRVYSTRFLLTHGDSLGVKGGDGIIGAIGPIMRGTLKASKSEACIGRDFDYIVMGHWHQTLWLPGAIVNNCLKGYDEYARLALRAPFSLPSQSLWFVHPVYGITARWEVLLEKPKAAADLNPKEWLSWQA